MYCNEICIFVDLPISSINGAIRNVTPTKSKHINKSRHAVAMIVHRARCDISSGSITCAQNVECNGMEWNEKYARARERERENYCTDERGFKEMCAQHAYISYASKCQFEPRFMFHHLTIKLEFFSA